MSFSAALALIFQRFLGHLVLLPLCWVIILVLFFFRKYRIENLREIRKRYGQINRAKQPLLICANHLTMIDSAILHWALSGTFRYFFQYRTFAWNLPAVENFGSSLFKRVVTYVSKCILIDRQGTKEHSESILKRVAWLLRHREACMIFPEGTRSRTGRIDVENTTYGIGQIISRVPECTVLCIYLRARGQISYSHLPDKGSSFTLDLALIKPTTADTGRRAHRDLSLQVITKLKEMEDNYHGARMHRGRR